MIMISTCFSINTWLNYNPLKYYFIYLHWPLHGTPLIARVAVLTVDVEHEGVLDGLQRHGGVERLAPQRAAVVLDARPVLEQRHVLLLQPGLRYTSVLDIPLYVDTLANTTTTAV